MSRYRIKIRLAEVRALGKIEPADRPRIEGIVALRRKDP